MAAPGAGGAGGGPPPSTPWTRGTACRRRRRGAAGAGRDRRQLDRHRLQAAEVGGRQGRGFGRRRVARSRRALRRRQRTDLGGFQGARRQAVEGGDQRAGGGEALGRVLGQQLAQDVLVAALLDRQFRQRLGEVGQGGGERVLAVVGQLAGEDLVEHHAQRVEVGAAVDLLPAGLLRAHVAGGADGEADLGELGIVLDRLGDAEVREHRGAVGAEQDIGRLHVSMHQALGVRVAERGGHLPYVDQAQLGIEALLDALLERAVGQVFHGHVVATADVADVVDGHRVRVRQPRQGPTFAQEAFGEARVGGQRRGHHLQRHLALQRALGGQVDRGHGAFAQLAFDVESRKFYVHVRLRRP